MPSPSLTRVCLCIIVLLCLSSLYTRAQEQNRISFVFKGFQAPPNSANQDIEILNERMLNKLISIQKFNVLKRDASLWKSIEDELKIQDFIDAGTAIKLGNMLGAKLFLEGKLTYISLRTEETRNSSGAITSTSYNFVAEASLSLVNLETGKYDLSVTTKQYASKASVEESFQTLVTALVDDLSRNLSKKFLVDAAIKSIEGADHVKIDKGALEGVETQQLFIVPDQSDVTFRIIEVSLHHATGRILSGNSTALTVGQKVKEAESVGKNSLHVTQKKKSTVYLDGGKNIGIKQGDVFVSHTASQIDIGSRVISENKVDGGIYIIDVKDDYSKGIIYRGNKKMVKGVTVIEADKGESYRANFLSLGYKYGLGQTVKATPYAGVVTVENGIGSYDVDTEYNRAKKDLNSVSIYAFSFSTRHLVRQTTTSLNIDVYDIGNGELKTWIPNLEFTFDPIIIPEKINWMIGGSFGYARMKQKLPYGTVNIISGGKSSVVDDYALPGSVITGFQFSFGKLRITTVASYDFIKFSGFSYDIENDQPDGADFATAPAAIMPYPTVNLSGLYVRGTLSYQIQ